MTVPGHFPSEISAWQVESCHVGCGDPMKLPCLTGCIYAVFGSGATSSFKRTFDGILTADGWSRLHSVSFINFVVRRFNAV